MGLPKELIKRFMKKMGLKIFMFPEIFNDGSIRISLKVKRGDNTEYYCYDRFKMNSEGKLVWYSSSIEIGADEGIFSYLSDNNAVDYFLLEISKEFAQKYMDEKIKS